MEKTNELQKLDLNRLEAKEGTLKIVHEVLPTQELEKLHEEEPVILTGTISAPANFYTKRTGEINNLKSHVKYNYRERKIELVTIEDFSELGSEITGKLTINPVIKELGINEDKTFFVSDLLKHIRKNKFYFSDAGQHKNIVTGLQNFSATVNAEITKINNNKGDINEVLKVTTKSNAELTFKCKLPVFIGQETKSFDVEIACAADSNAIKFWFESPALFELLELDTKSIIDGELLRFNDELVFVEQ